MTDTDELSSRGSIFSNCRSEQPQVVDEQLKLQLRHTSVEDHQSTEARLKVTKAIFKIKKVGPAINQKGFAHKEKNPESRAGACKERESPSSNKDRHG